MYVVCELLLCPFQNTIDSCNGLKHWELHMTIVMRRKWKRSSQPGQNQQHPDLYSFLKALDAPTLVLQCLAQLLQVS